MTSESRDPHSRALKVAVDGSALRWQARFVQEVDVQRGRDKPYSLRARRSPTSARETCFPVGYPSPQQRPGFGVGLGQAVAGGAKRDLTTLAERRLRPRASILSEVPQ